MKTINNYKNNFISRIIQVTLCIVIIFSCLPVDFGLKFNAITKTEAAGNVNDLINFALSQVGIKERSDRSDDILYNDWYYGRRVKNPNTVEATYAWCHVFVSYCADRAGCASIIPKTASCAAGVNWFKSKKQYHTRASGYQPRIGDIIYINTGGVPHHVGIVYAVDSQRVYYVDGNNTSTNPHGVAKSSKLKSDTRINGYGSPNYSGGGSSNTPSQPDKPSQSNPSYVKSSIDDVRIDSIDFNHITVSFTANNSALAKVNVTSVSTGETKEQSFTSGLSRITYTFNTSTMNNPGKDFYVRIYAYRTRSGGDETLHAVTYGPTIGRVHMPDKEIKYNIEALPSNLITTGKIGGWVTGENIAKVTAVVNNVEYECSRMDRPDVANAFPGYSGSGAGFYLNINALNVRHGSNDLIIRAYTSDNDYVEIYNGTFTATKLHEIYFDWSWYYARYCSIDPDIAAIGPNYERLIEHFYTVGISKGYSPCIGLNIKWYLDKNADVKRAVGGTYEGAYSHFVNFCMGANEFRETSEFLNLMYYKKTNSDLQNMTSAGLFMHYYRHGSRLEGRLGNTTNEAEAFVKAYSPKEYAKWNKDVENCLGNGTTFESAGSMWHHFLVYALAGNEKNRRITDAFDLPFYMSRYGISNAAAAFWRFINSGYANNEQAIAEQSNSAIELSYKKLNSNSVNVGTVPILSDELWETVFPVMSEEDEFNEIETPSNTFEPEETLTPVVTEKPKKSDKPIITEQPKESKKPIITEQPKESEKPIITEEPKASEKPIITEQPKESKKPIITEEPKASEKPIVTEEPKASEKPIVTEEPKASEKPIITERPKASEKPIITEQPKESENPQPTDNKWEAESYSYNLDDVVLSLKIALGLTDISQSEKTMDFNGDGRVTLDEVQYLLKVVIKVI